MVAELVANSKITIPEEIIGKIGLSVGDKLNIAVQGKNIILAPVSDTLRIAGELLEFEPVQDKSGVRPPFKFESMKGKMWIAEDFDEPLDDFKEYM